MKFYASTSKQAKLIELLSIILNDNTCFKYLHYNNRNIEILLIINII